MIKSLILLLLCFVKPADQKIITATNIRSGNALKTGWYYVIDEKNNYLRHVDKGEGQYYIDPKPIVSIKHVSKIVLSEDHARGDVNPYELVFRFDDTGTKAFSTATGKWINKKIALIIDDKLIFAATVQGQIPSGISSLTTGTYTKAELEEFEKKMEAEM